ncbi:MAG: DUF4339 domain-containing protein [Bacteroides sp.]|nr:DUF4339 domain-containing protein [Bacteroides sp.]
MIQTMNQTMSQMRVVGVNTGVNMATPQPVSNTAECGNASAVYYAAIDGHQAGPLSVDDVKQLVELNKISCDTLIWRQGLTGWMCVSDVPEVYKMILLNK